MQTSLHGFSYMGTEPGILRKLLWVLVVLTAYVFAAYFIQDNIQEYISSTIVTSTNSTTASLQHILFPGIVICNINQVSRAFVKSTNVDSAEGWSVLETQFLDDNSELYEQFLLTGVEDKIFEENIDELDRILKQMESIYKWNRTESFVKIASQVMEGFMDPEFSTNHIFIEIFQNCSDLILYSSWKSKYGRTFYDGMYVGTDYGGCCYILPYSNFENPKTSNISPSEYSGEEWHSLKRGAKNGIHNGLKLILDVESWDYASSRGAQGVNIVIGDPFDKVTVNQVL